MAVKANILQGALKSSNRISYKKEKAPIIQQKKALKRILRRAKDTSFGKVYRFDKILNSNQEIQSFQRFVPIHDYDSIHDKWWFRTIRGEEDVCWPGRINRFALSSGTSGSPSKQIPVSRSQMRKIRKASLLQMTYLNQHDFPKDFFEASILGVGGSSTLTKIEGRKEGDLSGIISANLPSWFSSIYKPEKEISAITDWDEKIEEMVKAAPNWNIGIIAGIPAWIQILLENIIERYDLKNIHELWPNFNVLVHGGVAFGPYKENFQKLLGKEIDYMETYLASEGFMAISSGKGTPLKLLLNNGIFFEFIPFNEDNFTPDGKIVEYPEILTIDQVKEHTDYAIIISTCAGAWRYMIGDTIKFLNTDKAEIIITGRTKHFLSLCGEHLSVDNMNNAIEKVAQHFNIQIPEFTVTGFAYENLFAHKWYIGVTEQQDPHEVKTILDKALCQLNDDYAVERTSALKEVFIEILPVEKFYDYLAHIGKQGGQVKFPRVIKGDFLDDWETYLNKKV